MEGVNIPVLWMVLVGFIAAVAIGYKFKLNIGVIAMVLAFFIGCFGMQLKASKVVSMWPTSIIFTIIAICFFFRFAGMNGTLDTLTNKMLYLTKGSAAAVPWVILFMGMILGAMGAGNAVGALLCPIGMVMAKKTKQNPLLIALAYTCGNLSGSDNPFSGYGGNIMKGCIETAGFADEAMNMAVRVWANGVLKNVLIFALFYFLLKGWKGENIKMDAPPKFNKEQKTTFIIIICTVLLVVVPKILVMVAKNKFTTLLSNSLENQFVLIAGAFLCVVLKLGNERKAISGIPWNTILMIAGVCMLMSVATEAGAAKVMAKFVENSIPAGLIGLAMAAIAAAMSFFSGAVSVVTPTLFPFVPAIAAAAGLDPTFLFGCVYIGANSTALSPFSTAGSLAVAACVDEEQREGLFYKLIPFCLIVGAVTIIYGALLGGFKIF